MTLDRHVHSHSCPPRRTVVLQKTHRMTEAMPPPDLFPWGRNIQAVKEKPTHDLSLVEDPCGLQGGNAAKNIDLQTVPQGWYLKGAWCTRCEKQGGTSTPGSDEGRVRERRRFLALQSAWEQTAVKRNIWADPPLMPENVSGGLRSAQPRLPAARSGELR